MFIESRPIVASSCFLLVEQLEGVLHHLLPFDQL